MFILDTIEYRSIVIEAAVDSLLLSLFILPVVYLFVVIPLKQRIKQLETITKEKEGVIEEYIHAMDRVKKLQEILPICASCKKIRNDAGYWELVEDYFSTYSVLFTHSICPECVNKLYPSLLGENNENTSPVHPVVPSLNRTS